MMDDGGEKEEERETTDSGRDTDADTRGETARDSF
jgi:hypothetical protein